MNPENSPSGVDHCTSTTRLCIDICIFFDNQTCVLVKKMENHNRDDIFGVWSFIFFEEWYPPPPHHPPKEKMP